MFLQVVAVPWEKRQQKCSNSWRQREQLAPLPLLYAGLEPEPQSGIDALGVIVAAELAVATSEEGEAGCCLPGNAGTDITEALVTLDARHREAGGNTRQAGRCLRAIIVEPLAKKYYVAATL